MNTPPASDSKQLHLVISGRVQGVGYRASAAEAARARGLCGWVRNLPGGEVELLAEGSDAALAELLAFCRRGPPAARVDSIDIKSGAATGKFSGFSVRRDT